MIRQPISTKWRFILGTLSILLLILGYAYLSHRQHLKNPEDTTIPTFSQLKKGIIKIVEPSRRSGEVWLLEDAKATFGRLFLGLLVGALAAVILGLLMGCFTPVESFFIPPLSTLAKLPATAMLTVFFVMVGTDTKMYIAMIAFGVLPTLAQTIYLSAKDDVPNELIYKSYTLGASHFDVVWNVIYKHIMPKMIDSIRLQIGPAMVFLIAAEMVMGNVGFGYRIRLQSRLLNMNVVYPYLAILAIFGYIMDYGLRFLLKKLCPWYAERYRPRAMAIPWFRMLGMR